MGKKNETLPVKAPDNAPMEINGGGLNINSLDQAYRFAKCVSTSGLIPYGLNTPEKVLVAAQTGMEAGLSFMAAVKSVFVIKGTPTWYGKSGKGLILNSDKCEDWNEDVEGEGEARHAWVTSKRRGLPTAKTTRFTIADAIRLGLYKLDDNGNPVGRTKDGWSRSVPWAQATDTMLMWRAIGRHCDLWYSDVLLGLSLKEVVEDVDHPGSVAPAAPPVTEDSPDNLLAQAVSDEEISKGEVVEPAPSSGDDQEQAAQTAPVEEQEAAKSSQTTPEPPPAAAAPKPEPAPAPAAAPAPKGEAPIL